MQGFKKNFFINFENCTPVIDPTLPSYGFYTYENAEDFDPPLKTGQEWECSSLKAVLFFESRVWWKVILL